MPDITPPPFPDDVPTVPLLVIDYALLQAGDEHEIDRLWKAATELGFWYLKNHGTDAEVDAMLEMGAHTMALPLEEKMKFEQGDGGNSFGYKFAGSNATDASGALDSVEFINVSKDDALAFPAMVHRKYPRTVEERMDSAVRPFVRKSMEVNQTLMDALNDRLGLPPGKRRHQHLRLPTGRQLGPILISDRSYVDGNVYPLFRDGAYSARQSFLHNRLGGLQVLPPGTDEWKYVKPIPGHAICNLGDAMAIFSAGILRSNLHRVVLRDLISPRGFPSADLLQKPKPRLNQREPRRAGTQRVPRLENGSGRRIQNQRIKNRAGPETWMASRGTEHKEAY
ncbi:Clavaminate synthase-like protein [Lactarius hengduanensis]|nr:Clavaminate synthase-like protein [Lactarius hengduanensis]